MAVYSGVAGVWATGPGDFVARNFPGTGAGIQQAIDYAGAGGTIWLGTGTFDIPTAGLQPKSNQTIRGAGMGATILRLANGADSGGAVHVILVSSKTDVTVRDLTIDGNKANNTSTAGSGIRCLLSTRIRLNRIHAKDCEQDGFYISGCTDVAVRDCVSTDNLRNGYSCGDANNRSTYVHFLKCRSANHRNGSNNAIGFALEPASYSSVEACESVDDNRGVTIVGGGSTDSTHNTISHCKIIDFTVSGIVVNPGTAGSAHNTIDNNILKPAGAVAVSTTAAGTTTLTTAANFLTAGVRVGDQITGGSPAPPANTVVVSIESATSLTMNNAITAGTEPQSRTFTRPVVEGIQLTGANDVIVRGNHVGPLVSNNSVGIVALTSLTRFKIDGNHVHQTHRHGIQIAGGVRGTINGNTVRNSSGETDNTYDGIRVADTTDTTIDGNNVFDDRGGAGNNMNYAIQSAGSSDRLSVCGNQMNGMNQGLGIALVGINNRVRGNQGVATSVASAAALVIPHDGDSIIVTGTTSITSINVTTVGRIISLIFTGALTFTNGNNIKLAGGNFGTSANDTITLAHDGVNYMEISRQANP